MPRHRESLEQQAFVQWCALHPLAKRIFAVPNGGQRSKITAAILKAEGVRPGVPDLMLPVAAGGAHGLFLEMKAPDGSLSPAQREELELLAAEGYCAVAAWGAGAAIEATLRYLSGTLPAGVHRVKSST